MFRVIANRPLGSETYGCSGTANFLGVTESNQIDHAVQFPNICAVRDTVRPSLGRPGLSGLAFHPFRRTDRIFAGNLACSIYIRRHSFACTNDSAEAKNNIGRFALGTLDARKDTSCSLVAFCPCCLCLWLYARHGRLRRSYPFAIRSAKALLTGPSIVTKTAKEHGSEYQRGAHAISPVEHNARPLALARSLYGKHEPDQSPVAQSVCVCEQ